MHSIGVQKIFAHYTDMLVDYCQLLDCTLAFDQGIKQGFEGVDVMGFIQERERHIATLEQKEAESIPLRAVVCQVLGLSEFTLDDLNTKIPKDSLYALSQVIDESKKVIEEIQEIDIRLSQTINIEMEATKLELHRFQSANRLHHAYQTENEHEAHFIDKTQ